MDWEQPLVEAVRVPELEEEALRVYPQVPVYLPYLASSPWLVRMLIAGSRQAGALAHLDDDFADLVFLAVSQDNSCRYCYASQRTLLRLSGVPEHRIRQLEETSFAADLRPEQRLALDFARRVSRSDPAPTREDVDALREAGYPDRTIKELATFAAASLAGNRITTLAAVPTESIEALPDRWSMRLLRPLIGRRLRRGVQRGVDRPLAPDENTGPWAYLIAAIAPLPYARVFRGAIDDFWASPVLGRRVKALVAAVIARGLGAGRAERESRELLVAEGLEEKDLEEILAHLGSPDLDPAEAVALPFARDTIRSQGATLQRRARIAREQLSPEQFVELIGVTSIANASARLDFLVDAG
jgi:AhpD family alkylhydroperoxidase